MAGTLDRARAAGFRHQLPQCQPGWHDSNGVIAIPTYIDHIKAGLIVPRAEQTSAGMPHPGRHRRPLGFGFHVDAQGDGAHPEEARTSMSRLHRVSAKLHRTACRDPLM